MKGRSMKMNDIISVIVPAFNEEGNIAEFSRLFAEMMQKSAHKYELIFVDDGSTDGTYDRIIEEAQKHPHIKYKRHPYNIGLTEALQTGFSLSSGDIFVFYPADLQYLPEDIPALVAPIYSGAELVTGWKQGKYKKKLVSSIYNSLSRRIFRLKVHDLNSVKAFKADVIKDIFLRRDWHRYLVVLAVDKGHKIEEVKIPLYERRWGKSKFSVWRIPIGVLDMIAVKAQLSLLKKPLIFFGLGGSIFFALGFLIGLVALYFRFILNEGFRPLLYLVMLLAGVGLGFFILGFLSEGLAALKEELGAIRKKLDNIEQSLKK
ncbi:MAG: glycosyltransferase family 2 protein [candidate division Zixibacteria bacterium]|nr:glycosyltransferase family 2 protein [candidate division Zixibacteria bacterium]